MFMYKLVHSFNNRWLGVAAVSILDNTLKIGYQKLLSIQNSFHTLCFDFFRHLEVGQNQHLLGLTVLRNLSQDICVGGIL